MTLFFRIDTITNQVRYRTRATWWRSRPAHNLQRSNGAGPPCHPRTPPKAAQPKAQIRAAVQTMLTAKRNVGTTCENVERCWRLASAGSWPFALSEIGAKPSTGKDHRTKLFDPSATLFIDTSVDAPSAIIKSFTLVLVTILALSDFFGDRGSAVVLSISDTRYSRIVKRSRKLEKKSTSNRLLKK